MADQQVILNKKNPVETNPVTEDVTDPKKYFIPPDSEPVVVDRTYAHVTSDDEREQTEIVPSIASAADIPVHPAALEPPFGHRTKPSVTWEEYQQKKLLAVKKDPTLAKYRDLLRLEVLKDGDKEVGVMFKQYNAEDELVDTFTFPAGSYTSKQINRLFHDTKSRMERKGVTTLGGMPGRRRTLARRITENLYRRTTEAPLWGAIMYSLSAGRTATIPGAILLAYNLSPTSWKEAFNIPEGFHGELYETEEVILWMDKVERNWRDGPIGDPDLGLFDKYGTLKPLTVDEVNENLDTVSPDWAITTSNLALEQLLTGGGFILGLKMNREFLKTLTEQADDVAVAFKNKHGREPNVLEAAKLLELRVKAIAQTSKEGKDWVSKRIQNLANVRNDLVFEFSRKFGKNFTAYGVTDGSFILSSYGLDKMADGGWDIGGGYNTMGAILTSITSGGVITNIGIPLVRGLAEPTITAATFPISWVGKIKDPKIVLSNAANRTRREDPDFIISLENKLNKNLQRGQKRIKVEDEHILKEMIEVRATTIAGGDPKKIRPLHREEARRAIIKENEGGIDGEKIISWLRGENTLEGLGLQGKHKEMARGFIKNFQLLSPDSQVALISHVKRATVVTDKLLELGIKDPEAGFGLLFGLNTLRAAEPDILMQGLARYAGKDKSGFWRKSLFKQVSLEEYYQTKMDYTRQLEDQYKRILMEMTKNQNLRNKGALGFIQTDVQEYLDDMGRMITKLGQENTASKKLLKKIGSLTIEDGKNIIDDPRFHDKVEQYIKAIKKIDPNAEEVFALAKQFEAKKILSGKNLVRAIQEAKTGSQKEAATGRAIALPIINKMKNLRDEKNRLYALAREQSGSVQVDSTRLYDDLTEMFALQSKAKKFKESTDDVELDIRDVFNATANAYFVKLSKEIPEMSSKNVDEFIKIFARKNGDGELLPKIMGDSASKLRYMMDNNVLAVPAHLKPAFTMGVGDLKDMRMALNALANRSKGEGQTTTQAFRSLGLEDIVKRVDSELDDLALAGKYDSKLWDEGDAANMIYHDAKATRLIRDTVGTRHRFMTDTKEWYYKTPVEEWGNKIFNNPLKAQSVYDDIERVFGSDKKAYDNIIEAINQHALSLIQHEAFDSKLAAMVQIGRKGKLIADPDREYEKGARFIKEKIKMIEALELASGGKFNFKHAYNFSKKLTDLAMKDKSIIKKLKEADVKRAKYQDTFNDLYIKDKGLFVKRLEKLGMDIEKWTENPQAFLTAFQSGSIKKARDAYKRQHAWQGRGKAEKQFDAMIHSFFVEGFTKAFTGRTGTIRVVSKSLSGKPQQFGGGFGSKGVLDQFETDKMLDGQAVIDFLADNGDLIKKYIPDIEIDKLRYIVDATAMRQVVPATAGVENITSGLTKLTIGSYVSRLYAVSSGRTGLTYVGVEALVVQLQRHEVEVMAALMMNPQASRAIAKIISSGKPIPATIESSKVAWLPELLGQIDALIEEQLFEPVVIEESTLFEPTTMASMEPTNQPTSEVAMLNSMQQNIGGANA